MRHRLSYFHLCPIWPHLPVGLHQSFFFWKFYNKNIFCRVLWSLIISFTIKEKQLLLCKGLKKIRPWKKNYRRGFKSIGFFYPVNHITSLRNWLSVGMKRLKILNKNANFVGKAEFGFVSQVLKHACRLLLVVRYINKYFTMFLKTVSPKTHQGGSWKKLKDKTISLIKMPPKKWYESNNMIPFFGLISS